jgi:hypothetical protein
MSQDLIIDIMLLDNVNDRGRQLWWFLRDKNRVLKHSQIDAADERAADAQAQVDATVFAVRELGHRGPILVEHRRGVFLGRH